jgi:FkbM family methyltransferase
MNKLEDQTFVIFGCGELGRRAVRNLRSCFVEPLAYCDNNRNLWGATLDGLPVLSPSSARLLFPTASYVVGIFNPSRVKQQLDELGLKAVSYPYLCREFKFADTTLRHLSGDDYVDATTVFDLLADAYSQDELDYLLEWHGLSHAQPAKTRLHSDPKDIYFPQHLYKMGQDEVFVDCGAFDGDTYLQFLHAADGKFKQAFLIEPDPRNVKSLPENDDVEVVQAAVSDHVGKVSFDAAGTAGSTITDAGSTQVRCVTLDYVFSGNRSTPTIIKIDVEGHELEVLAGAKETIKKHQPVLAVCAYHKPEHLWQIPQLIHKLNPSYKIYLRRYAEDCWETVYYAIPPGRVWDRS